MSKAHIMNMPTHPDPERLAAYLLGNLPAAERVDVQTHLASCEDCRSKAETLSDNDPFKTPPTISFAGSAPKQIVAGHELQRELARGGLGVVYLAHHPHLLDYRAIKRPLMRPSLDREVVLARFKREVQAVGSLRHDHVIRAHDAGADDDGPYLVMEYLDGKPLSRVSALHGPLPVPLACELIRQAALGLQAAHERGLVHRDVKPSNLMLARVNTGTARVVVIDWGLVKRTSDVRADGVTLTQTAMGTPGYMSPEQIRDAQSVDIRADIYSLGVTFYVLLMGKAPFHDRPESEKLAAHLDEELPPLEGVPKDVAGIVKKMVAKRPAQRFATPGEVAQALEPMCSNAAGLIDLLEEEGKPRPMPVRPRRRRWMLAVAALAASMLLTLGVLWSLLFAMIAPAPWGLGGGPKEAKGIGDGPNGDEPPGVLGHGPATPVRMKDSHPGHCSSIVFTADGLRAVSESGGGSVYLWDLQTRDSHSWLHFIKLPAKGEDVGGLVAVSADGNHMVAAGLNSHPREMYYFDLYDQKTGTLKTAKFVQAGKMGTGVAFSPTSAELAIVDLPGLGGIGALFYDPTIRVINVQTGADKSRFKCNGPVNSLAFSPDGLMLLTGGDDRTVRLWHWQTKKHELSFPGHEGAVSQVAFSADGRRLYSASLADETLRVWDKDRPADNEVKRITLRKTTAKTLCATFWPGGRALTGHVDGDMVLWDLEQGQELKRFSRAEVQITAVAISPDGHHAVAAHSDRTVYLYRLPVR